MVPTVSEEGIKYPVSVAEMVDNATKTTLLLTAEDQNYPSPLELTPTYPVVLF